MVGCGRFIRIIFLTLGFYLLTVNIILWATEPSVNIALRDQNWLPSTLGLKTSFVAFHNYSIVHYRGFSWFFNRISTFPGPLFTHSILMTYSNIVSGFNVTNNVGIDVVIAIFRVLSTPLMLGVTIFIDILNNAAWFIGFVIN